MIRVARRSRWAVGFVFGILVFIGLARGRTSFWNDPGTFWHLRLGRDILRTGTVPRHDHLTYSRAQASWVDQSWAFDVLLATIVDRFGRSGATAITIVGLASLYAALAARLIREGGSPPGACLTAFFAAGIGSVHFLIRPHLFTLFFVFWTAGACRARHRGDRKALWPLPIVMIVWANLHGGFAAGSLILLVSFVAESLSGGWDDSRRRAAFEFALGFVVSVIAPLLNPYGFGLYRHVYELLVQQNVTDLIVEHQPISFGKPESRLLEAVLFALIGLGVVSKNKSDLFDWSHALTWLYLALGSIRHAPLFALVAAPLLTTLIDGSLSSELLNGSLARAESSRARTWTFPCLIGVTILGLVPLGVSFGGPDPKRWPLDALTVLDRQPTDRRVFHELEWGGLIASECRPRRRSFIDDRFELYGRAAVLDYLDAMEGGPAWEDLFKKTPFDLVWIKPERALARRLSRDAEWIVLRRDSTSVLFERKRTGVGKGLANR